LGDHIIWRKKSKRIFPAEIGLPVALPAWRRPKAEFKARESPPNEAYFAYAAVSAG